MCQNRFKHAALAALHPVEPLVLVQQAILLSGQSLEYEKVLFHQRSKVSYLKKLKSYQNILLSKISV